MAKLNVGDRRFDGSIEIVAEDTLCYLVKSVSGGSQGIRTISKALLKEWAEALHALPNATSAELRAQLAGKSDVDRYEYGYNATLYKLAEMVLDTVQYEHAPQMAVGVEAVGLLNLQRITYGAPGTGKSWGIEELVKTIPDRVFRTTFHPDCDYSTFVGAYKPTMETVPRLAMVGKQIEKVTFGSGFTDEEKSELEYEKKIVYKFVEQAFTKAYVKAWRAQAAAIAAGAGSAEAIYLVIEEINRGNCAQVFGDIFQLLDREDGYSKYPVKADEDLRRHLKETFDGLDFGTKYAKVQTGEDLVLPNNLCIWATMNTSDQSLFPMDSAFKRRWDWEYVPIKDGGKGWKIVVQTAAGAAPVIDSQYDWWKFLEAVNVRIGAATHSEDKKLGYYFVKPDDGINISYKRFLEKVIFYLWNDVFKDYGLTKIFKDANGKPVEFHRFYDAVKGQADAAMIKTFLDALGLTDEKAHPASPTAPATPPSPAV